MMTKSTLGCFAIAVALVAGCGGGGGSSSYSAADIQMQTPQGSMNGTSWTMVASGVQPSSDGGSLSVSLASMMFDGCGFGVPDGPTILFTVPRMEGEYPLQLDLSGGQSQTVTFSPSAGTNDVATEGVVTVDALSDTQVTIGLLAKTGSSSVNGRFTTTICPSSGL